MGRHKLFYKNAKTVRDSLNFAIELADTLHQNEKILVEHLYRIDQERFYVRYGHRSLTGFCRKSCRFSKTQAQRLVTRVRRHVPTDNIVDEESVVDLLQMSEHAPSTNSRTQQILEVD